MDPDVLRDLRVYQHPEDIRAYILNLFSAGIWTPDNDYDLNSIIGDYWRGKDSTEDFMSTIKNYFYFEED